MISTSLISIIIPIYNVEKYLPKCLDSVISQTYTNIEIILVNDGSTDSSGLICDDYALKDSRIKVIHKENGGVSSARNIGLDTASGDYVMFVDSDDYVEVDFCEKSLKMALEMNADIVSFGFYRERIDGTRKEVKTVCPRTVSPSEGIKELITKKDYIYNFLWNKIFRLNLFLGLRYPIGKEYEDQNTYLLFHKANTIYVSDLILYHYVYRDNSITSIWYKPEAIETRFRFWLERLAFLRVNYPENVEAQVKQLINEALIGYVRLVGKWKYRKSVSMFSSFMDNNKDMVLSLRKDKMIKKYYFNKYLFYLYCIYYRLRFLRSNE